MKPIRIFLFTLLFFPRSVLAQTPSEIIDYINSYKSLAMNEMHRSGIPAAIILAQGIHETQAGTSELVRKSNNHFGIKCKDTWTGKVVYHDDDRSGECFRSYATPEDSYADHSDFLRNSPRYQFLFKLDPENYRGWATGLKKAGYATNIKYPQILIRLIEDYHLEQYTLIAMGKMPSASEVVMGVPVLPAIPDTAAAGPQKEPSSSLAAQYPTGEFSINRTRVIYEKAGRSLLAISNQYELPLARLLEFNDLSEEEVLIRDQLLFLQRKRKTGTDDFHTVREGEDMYDISQQQGMRLESLLTLNQLVRGQEPAVGEKLYCQSPAPARPLLREERPHLPATDLRTTMAPDSSKKGIPITHIVQSKETLFSISQKYGVDIQKIQQWNKLDSLSLKPGQELIIYKN